MSNRYRKTADSISRTEMMKRVGEAYVNGRSEEMSDFSKAYYNQRGTLQLNLNHLQDAVSDCIFTPEQMFCLESLILHFMAEITDDGVKRYTT